MSLLVLDIFNMSMEFNWVSLDIHWYTFHMVFVPLVRILEEFCRFCIFIEVWISQLIINTNNSWNWYCLCAIILFTLMYYKGTIKDCPYQQRMDSLPGLFLPVAVWSTLPPISLSFPTSYWPAWTLPPLILPAFFPASFILLWRWRQHGHPKHWYPTTSLHVYHNPGDSDMDRYTDTCLLCVCVF